MNKENKIDAIANRGPAYTKRYVRKSIDIADRLFILMQEKEMSQKDLAKALKKSPSEINKWLSGQHNFTVKTMAAIEEVLQSNLFSIPCGKRQMKYYPEQGWAEELARMIENGEMIKVKLPSGLEWNVLDHKKNSNPLPKKSTPTQPSTEGAVFAIAA